MLTKLVEVSEAGNRRLKADQYWPNQEQENLVFPRSGLRVEQIRHRDLSQGNYVLRKFLVSHGNQTRGTIVHQLHCMAWPDHDVPSSPDLLLELVREANSLSPDLSSPILVHCSAGVGRTGTFIAVHKLLRELERARPGTSLEVARTVLEMRKCRARMVQTLEQYVYIYKCLDQLFEEDEEEDDDYYNNSNYYNFNSTSYYENEDIV